VNETLVARVDPAGSAGSLRPVTPGQWRAAARKVSGSWWEDWASWSAARPGPAGAPPAMGSGRYPPLGDAPGEYLRG
jgi:polyhydroxyalkanoate synthase